MKALYIILITAMLFQGDKILYDFNSAKTSGQWNIVNDGVMGGVSQSKINLNKNGTATFSGNLSPDNNGGFASIRSKIETKLDDNFQGVFVKLRGDGNIYSLRFRTSSRFDGFSYEAKVQTEEGEWKEFKVPFKDFKPTFRGYSLNDKAPLAAENIKQIAIMISDKQWGEFTLDLDWIKLY